MHYSPCVLYIGLNLIMYLIFSVGLVFSVLFIRIHLREMATNRAKIHSLAPMNVTIFALINIQ